MRDPHVQALLYQIGTDVGLSYDNPDPISFTNSLGNFQMKDGVLRIVPTEHFCDISSLRMSIDPFLEAWEIATDLTSNVGTIRFSFERGEVVDRDPPPSGSPQIIKLNGMSTSTFGGRVSLHLTFRKYPEPPKPFSATPDVQSAYRRWIGYRCGKEPLQAMAYFVLTVVERSAHGRKKAANTFFIAKDILQKIGELTSKNGDESTARKATAVGKALTASEKQWLEEATRKVIHRLGEHASGVPLSLIDMTELPSL